MYYILIGIVIIYLLNFLISKINLLDKQKKSVVSVFENEVYKVVDITKKELKGSISNELVRVRVDYEKKIKHYSKIGIFIFDLVLLTSLLCPILSPKTYISVVLIGFSAYFFYVFILYKYIKKRYVLKVDTVAVKLMGDAYFKSIEITSALNKTISNLPSFFSEYPSLDARLKNARETYKYFNNKT